MSYYKALKQIDDLIDLITPTQTAIFNHDDCLKHKNTDEPNHSEKPERITSIIQQLKLQGLFQQCTLFNCVECTDNDIYLTHPIDYTQMIKNNCLSLEDDTDIKYYGGDTYYNKYSHRAAKLGIGGLVELMEKVHTNQLSNGIVLTRPPGHHCEKSKAMGFCLFNQVVCATNILKHKYTNLKKILVVDIDVHHGNGTQNLFYESDEILYFSIHRSDNGNFYPQTGFINETGINKGIGKTVNVPLFMNCGDNEYKIVFKNILIPIIEEFKPEMILISAGFDAACGDPLGGMNVTPYCYGFMISEMRKLCSKICLFLEGGYNLITMPRAVCCVVYALLNNSKRFEQSHFDDAIRYNNVFDEWKQYLKPELSSDDRAKFFGIIKNIIKIQKQYWKLLDVSDTEMSAEMKLNAVVYYEWECEKCTFINSVCKYECELCENKNAKYKDDTKQEEKVDIESESSLVNVSDPTTTNKLLEKYLLKTDLINRKFNESFGLKGMDDDSTVIKLCYVRSDDKQLYENINLIIKNGMYGVILTNNINEKPLDFVKKIKEVRKLYGNLWIGVQFNYNSNNNDILSNSNKIIFDKKGKQRQEQSTAIVKQFKGMGFQVEFDEFIFKFLNDNKLCDVINGLFMNDSGIGIKRRNRACLRIVQYGHSKFNYNGLYFGKVDLHLSDYLNDGINGNDVELSDFWNDCSVLANTANDGYMDVILTSTNGMNLNKVKKKLELFRNNNGNQCKLAVCIAKEEMHMLNDIVEYADVVVLSDYFSSHR